MPRLPTKGWFMVVIGLVSACAGEDRAGPSPVEDVARDRAGRDIAPSNDLDLSDTSDGARESDTTDLDGPTTDGGDGDLTECVPDTVVCQTTAVAIVCDETGRAQATPCDDGFVCVESEGCLEVVCEAEAGIECVGDDTTRVCNATGTAVEERACTGGRSCEAADPSSCVARVCAPGEGRCLEGGGREVCDEDGLFSPAEPCQPDELGTACYDGFCRTLCEVSRLTLSYLGCDYWAADLGNHFDDADDANFDLGFVVTNAHDSLDAEVVLSGPLGPVESRSVAPGTASTFAIEGPRPQNNYRTGLRRTAYRLNSTVPVAAYQFNPIETAEGVGDTADLAASTDASLLLPDPVLDDRFRVVAWRETRAPGNTFSGGSLLAVIGTQDGTRVTLTASAASSTGPGVSDAVGFAETRDFEIDAWDVLQLTTHTIGADWTGTVIDSSAPVAVFAGNECARVPAGTNFCDHLEEALFGLTAWGTETVATKSWARGEEADLYRIMAAENNTEVILGPPFDETFSLAAGQYHELSTADDFVVTADAPILVVQYLEGSGNVETDCTLGIDCSETGDPSMILLPPVGQYRTSYAFLTPDTYQQDFVNLVLTADEQVVLLDGEPVTAEAVGEGSYQVARVRVSDGAHQVESGQPFGLIVYGYAGNDDDPLEWGPANVSYGYPGGLNFLPLNPKDPQPSP